MFVFLITLLDFDHFDKSSLYFGGWGMGDGGWGGVQILDKDRFLVGPWGKLGHSMFHVWGNCF